MLLRRNSYGLLLALVALGCDAPSIERFTPKDADARSRDYLGLFTRGNVDSAVARLVVPIRTPQAAVELRKIADILRDARFDTVRVIGAQTNDMNGTRHVNLTYELYSSPHWFLANVATVDTAGGWLVEGVSARTIAQPLEVAARFSLTGKSAVHYLWLVMTLLCAAISLGSAIFIATRRAMPKRWRWVLLSLIGVGAFRLNWATGATNVAFVQIQLFSASYFRAGDAAPWIIAFSLPVGALLAIWHCRRWCRVRPSHQELVGGGADLQPT